MNLKISQQNEKILELQHSLSTKIDEEQHQEDLSVKMDQDQFYKWFPRDVLPADYFQAFIRKEC